MWRLAVVLICVLAGPVIVVEVFSSNWGPELSGAGDPPSASDGIDSYGFPLRYKSVLPGNCERDHPCDGTQESTSKLVANYSFGITGAVALAVIGGWIGLRATRMTRAELVEELRASAS